MDSNITETPTNNPMRILDDFFFNTSLTVDDPESPEKSYKSYQELIKDIEAKKEETQRWLETIKDEPTINIKKFIGIATTKSIEESITCVYKEVSSYITKCGSAIKSINCNLLHTLTLLKVLAQIDLEIMGQLDDEITSQTELKQILIDFCEKNGIHDTQINELLESSFKRAYTLRDRINQINRQMETINKKLDETDQHVSETNSDYQKLLLSYSKIKRSNKLLWITISVFLVIEIFLFLRMF